ncbi:MAG TPA: fumarylacetoacetate hydrolase family protein [Methanosphaera sp.]|nr:fumarylacetoacetate hydrolase family protein [Methanosphaera sp.]
MKYIRYETSDEKKCVGIFEDDLIYPTKYSSIVEAIENEETLKDTYAQGSYVNIDDVKILTPVNPTKVVCVGLNYKNHADELEMTLPSEPLLFMKPSSSVIASKEEIVYPGDTEKLDFEAELGIVILSEINRKNNDTFKIAYTIINDVTARDLQEKDGQWTRSKSFDTFCPVGPVIVTNINPLNQRIYSKVNGEIKQDSNTKNMIFSPEYLVEYISNIMTLYPGDLIATGTPPGIDHLKKDDVITIGIEDIGILENIVK